MVDSGALYALLVAAIGVTFYLQIEFLYLALIAVLLLLLIADRQPAPRYEGPQPLPENELPPGPVIIQQAPYSPANDFANDLISNIVQNVMDSSPKWSGGQLDEVNEKIGSLEKEISGLRKELAKDKKK